MANPIKNPRAKVWLMVGVMAGVLGFGQGKLFAGADERPGSAPTGADAKLTDQQFRGQGVFLQRCSLCHLTRALKSGNPPTVGPNLKSVFKNSSTDEEKDLRTFILNGTPHMPGFKSALSSKEIDDLIAYMKVM